MEKKRPSEGDGGPSPKKPRVDDAPAPAPPLIVFSAANPPVSQDEVVLWARQVGIDQDDAIKLKNPHKVDGAHLANTAKDTRIDIITQFVAAGISLAAAQDLADALPSLYPGARRGQINIQDNGSGGWKIAAIVRSVRNPALSFECEFIIDTGNLVGAISLPKKKVQELQLSVVRAEGCDTAGGPGVVKFYDPVRITLTDDKGNLQNFDVAPFVTPHGDQIYPVVAPGATVGPLPPQHGAVFPISPVKLPLPAHRTDVDEPLMGAGFLRISGLGLDTKNNCLYSIIGRI